MSIKNKIISFDCDGVLNNLDEEIITLFKPTLSEDEIKANCNNDASIFCPYTKEELVPIWEHMSKPEFWESLKPSEIAQNKIELLRQSGNDIIFCTAPYESCPNWERIRIDWLKKHFGAKGSKDIILTSKKEVVYADIFIDDRVCNIKKWNDRWYRLGTRSNIGFLFETRVNKYEDYYPRVKFEEGNWNFFIEEKWKFTL